MNLTGNLALQNLEHILRTKGAIAYVEKGDGHYRLSLLAGNSLSILLDSIGRMRKSQPMVIPQGEGYHHILLELAHDSPLKAEQLVAKLNESKVWAEVHHFVVTSSTGMLHSKPLSHNLLVLKERPGQR